MKVICVGIDGCTYQLIRKGISQRKLHAFKELIDEGYFSKLKSCYPPFTWAAWLSISTGKSLFQHGYFDWVFLSPSYEIKLLPKPNLPKLWDYLHYFDKQSILLNIPLTYPPESLKIKGIVVSGMDTPKEHYERCVYPSHYASLLRKFGYKIEPEYSKSKRKLFRNLKTSLKSRLKTFLYFLEHEKYDFFMCFIRETDIASHFLSEKEILSIYKMADRFLKEVKEMVDSSQETTLIIFSDHGFSYKNILFSPNVWLLNRNYLSLKRNKKKLEIAKKCGVKKEFIRSIVSIYPFKILRKFISTRLLFRIYKKIPLDSLTAIEAISNNIIYWKKTKALALGNYIYLNETGVFREGICKNTNKITQKLKKELENYFKEKNLNIKVKNFETFIKNRCNGVTYPKLVLIPSDDILLSNKLEGKEILTNKNIFDHSSFNGVFIGYGYNIRKQTHNFHKVNIEDITPTILHMFNLPIPDDMDGKVIMNMLVKRKSPTYIPAKIYHQKIQMKKIREKLIKAKI